jgi:hypothetical protein
MKKAYALLPLLLFLAGPACDDDNEKKYKGKITVQVNTSEELWGFPQIGRTLLSTLDHANDGKWMYPQVGGIDPTCGVDDEGVEDLADEYIISPDIGDRVNYVYLYGSLGVKSTTTPVLYRGTSSTNNSVVTIKNIAPGDYYVVAFYDYNSGGNRENLLNRFDRYSCYDASNEGTGTPFVNEADVITINEDSHDITLEIHADWAMGRPKSIADSGRVFMNSAPPEGSAALDEVPERYVVCPE